MRLRLSRNVPALLSAICFGVAFIGVMNKSFDINPYMIAGFFFLALAQFAVFSEDA